jgi:hypothetical protein
MSFNRGEIESYLNRAEEVIETTYADNFQQLLMWQHWVDRLRAVNKPDGWSPDHGWSALNSPENFGLLKDLLVWVGERFPRELSKSIPIPDLSGLEASQLTPEIVQQWQKHQAVVHWDTSSRESVVIVSFINQPQTKSAMYFIEDLRPEVLTKIQELFPQQSAAVHAA